jgi:hypothetical protein
MPVEWSYDDSPTIASSGNTTITIDRDVRSACFTLAKVSGGNVTALTIARSLDGATWGPARTVTLSASLTSAGDSVDVDLIDEPCRTVRFGITVSASTVVHILGRGVS